VKSTTTTATATTTTISQTTTSTVMTTATTTLYTTTLIPTTIRPTTSERVQSKTTFPPKFCVDDDFMNKTEAKCDDCYLKNSDIVIVSGIDGGQNSSKFLTANEDKNAISSSRYLKSSSL
jgi:hypothetical protein